MSACSKLPQKYIVIDTQKDKSCQAVQHSRSQLKQYITKLEQSKIQSPSLKNYGHKFIATAIALTSFHSVFLNTGYFYVPSLVANLYYNYYVNDDYIFELLDEKKAELLKFDSIFEKKCKVSS